MQQVFIMSLFTQTKSQISKISTGVEQMLVYRDFLGWWPSCQVLLFWNQKNNWHDMMLSIDTYNEPVCVKSDMDIILE